MSLGRLWGAAIRAARDAAQTTPLPSSIDAPSHALQWASVLVGVVVAVTAPLLGRLTARDRERQRRENAARKNKLDAFQAVEATYGRIVERLQTDATRRDDERREAERAWQAERVTRDATEARLRRIIADLKAGRTPTEEP